MDFTLNISKPGNRIHDFTPRGDDGPPATVVEAKPNPIEEQVVVEDTDDSSTDTKKRNKKS